jgi:hypothetical protein
MNGRVYDPLLARFGTPDPMTEDPFSTQGWNRYSYVGNSPLNFTDPSGYCFLGCFWKPIFKAIGNFISRHWGAIVQFAATAICTALPGCQPFLPLVAGAASAFVTGVTSGNLGLALRAGFISMVTTFVAQDVLGGIRSNNGPVASTDWGQPSGLGMSGLQSAGTQSRSLVQYAQTVLPQLHVETCITASCLPLPAPPPTTVSELAHGGLTVGSFLPSVVGSAFAAADGGLHWWEGNRGSAAISFGAASLGAFSSAGIVRLGATAATKGIAKIHYGGTLTDRTLHASVEVRFDGVALHTEVMPVNGLAYVQGTNVSRLIPPPLTIELPDAAAAMAYQRSVVGTTVGLYDPLYNSCLTHCARVLSAGGVPTSELQLLRMIERSR